MSSSALSSTALGRLFCKTSSARMRQSSTSPKSSSSTSPRGGPAAAADASAAIHSTGRTSASFIKVVAPARVELARNVIPTAIIPGSSVGVNVSSPQRNDNHKSLSTRTPHSLASPTSSSSTTSSPSSLPLQLRQWISSSNSSSSSSSRSSKGTSRQEEKRNKHKDVELLAVPYTPPTTLPLPPPQLPSSNASKMKMTHAVPASTTLSVQLDRLSGLHRDGLVNYDHASSLPLPPEKVPLLG